MHIAPVGQSGFPLGVVGARLCGGALAEANGPRAVPSW
jgi:hypothetical protein